jgi:TolB-like protein/DNA-binding winged helix-turn-helix (wHTH) protein/Flp pilus assembly protein TadD
MALQDNKLYEFGPYRLDAQKRLLQRDGETIPVTPKALEILVVLVDRCGEVVSKDELMESVWPDSYVEESNLTQNVFLLRKALGESAQDRNYIVTVPGKGYRFVGEVQPIPNGNGVAQPPPAATLSSVAVPAGQPSAPRTWLWLSAAVLLLIVSAAYAGWRFLRARYASQQRRIVLAVLPFENLTGDAAQDYLTDGLTEEMITQLGRFDPQRLGVIARTSVMHYKGSHQQLERIARELSVDYVLEGSLRRDADKVRITAQLIQVSDQTHLWARQYDRELTSLLALQAEIAQEVADEIQLTLGEPKRVSLTHQASLSPKTYEAYDLYLKGQYYWNKRTHQSLLQAIEYFQQAALKDPNYAPAYAGMANSYALLGGYTLVPQAEFMAKARAAALRALEIDESLPEAHTALALIVQNYDWDWQTAEKEYRRAIELNPNYATGHHWYAEHLAFLGQFDEALRESERARQLDPLSLIIATDNAAILYFCRQYDKSIDKFRTVLEMEPTFPRARIVIDPYVEKGLFADALAFIEDDRRRLGDEPWTWSALAYVYGRSGQQAPAQRALEKLEELNRRQPVDPSAILWAHVGMRNKDQAFVWLEKAYSQHSNALVTLKVEPAYEPLRSDARFQDLMRRVGLAQ